MKKLLISLLALAVLPVLAHANGEPVIYYSAGIRSSQPIPLKVTEVQVVREDLDINIAIPYSTVRVSYQLKNNSSKPIHVDYGFPVDFLGEPTGPHAFDGDGEYGSLSEMGVLDRAVRNVTFRLDDVELSWTHADEIAREVVYEDQETGEQSILEYFRLWTYTVLDIPAGKTVVLQVDYQVLNQWSTEYEWLKGSPMSRYFPSDGQFEYFFSPAKNWGNGKADVFNCTLQCDAFFQRTEDLYGYLNRYNKFQFEQVDKSTWTCHATDFDFEEAYGMVVCFYNPQDGKPYRHWGNPISECAVPKAAYTLKTSGAQDKYPTSNIEDGNLTTAWVAPGNGVGATIDIDFPTPRRVSDIGFYNGYHKSAALWAANSRIKKLRLEVTRADGYRDEPVEIDISGEEWDGAGKFSLFRDDSPAHFGDLSLLTITSLDRQCRGRETGRMDADENSIYEKVPFASEAVSHIRLTVLSVTPGTKYKDLCISDLLVFDGFDD